MQTTSKLSLDQLKSKLKTQDAIYGRLSKTLYIFYLIFIPIFLTVAVFEFIESKNMNVVLWALFNSIAFSIFAYLFRSYMKEYSHIDYSIPIIEMLKAAAQRYEPFQLKTIWALVAVVFVDLGLIFNYSERVEVLSTQLIFIPVFLGALIIGIIVWYIKYKPLRDNALRLIKELKE